MGWFVFEDTVLQELFTIPRNFLALEGAVFPQQEAPDVKASEIQKLKDMVNSSSLMGKPLDITESQISCLSNRENNVLFCASEFADNRCEGTLETLNSLMKTFYFFPKEQHIKGAAFSFHRVDIFVVTFAPLSPPSL